MLITFVKNPATRKVLAVEAHSHEPSGDRLSGRRKRLLALALAEVKLGRRHDAHLDDSVGELSRRQLVEPGSIKARVLRADSMKNLLPGRRVQTGGFMRAT